MPTEARRVTDDAGVEFVLGPKIAEGGQGAVYRVEGHPDYAIKIVPNEEDLRRIASVRRLPLDRLPLAAPLSLIRNGGFGYVMRLASDMTTIREPYLPSQFGRMDAAWYRETGGLRRRLAIASTIAQTIAGLHERGLAYVDLNPNNVMVSEALERNETWLIDTDNITSRTNPVAPNLMFRWYCAPERAGHGAPPSTLADTYSLAVLVFRLLVLRHPLEGEAADLVDENTAQVRADWGEFPYVADPNDDSNRLPPRSFPAGIFPHVMSGRLRRLAERTFTEGRHDPVSRPGSGRWRDVLFGALDNVIACPDGCGWTFYRLGEMCPSCGAPTPSSVVVTAYSGPAEHSLAARDSLVASTKQATPVLPRHLWGRYDQPDPVVMFRPTRGGFEIAPHDEARVTGASGKAVTKIASPAVGEVHHLRLDVPDRPTRYLAVRSVQPA